MMAENIYLRNGSRATINYCHLDYESVIAICFIITYTSYNTEIPLFLPFHYDSYHNKKMNMLPTTHEIYININKHQPSLPQNNNPLNIAEEYSHPIN